MIILHYVCSDIHGRWDKYELIFRETDINKEDTLYILGDETYYLVHAAPCSKYLKELVMYQDLKEDQMEELHLMIWSRPDRFLEGGKSFKEQIFIPGRRTIIGHTITNHFSPFNVNGKGQPRIYFDPCFIGIDCGCAMKGEEGCLGVLRLEDRKEYYI